MHHVLYMHVHILFCQLRVDTSTLDFGTAVIGETLKRSFTLQNAGALGTRFEFCKMSTVKPHTATTAETSLGRMVRLSLQLYFQI